MMNKKRPVKRTGLRARNERRLLPTVALVAVVVVLVFAGIAVARYVLQYQQEGLATATNFYFTSDYLKESSENASYFIDPETKSLSIEVRNSADSQRHAEVDIVYEVTASGATVTDGGDGKLTGNVASTATIAVKPENDTFTVTVASTSPYKKELTATFERASGNRYRVDDEAGNTAAVLTVTCIEDGNPVPLALPNGVIPDATDGRIGSKDGTYTFAAAESGVYSVVLLKSDKTVSLAKEDTSFTDEIKVGD